MEDHAHMRGGAGLPERIFIEIMQLTIRSL